VAGAGRTQTSPPQAAGPIANIYTGGAATPCGGRHQHHASALRLLTTARSTRSCAYSDMKGQETSAFRPATARFRRGMGAGRNTPTQRRRTRFLRQHDVRDHQRSTTSSGPRQTTSPRRPRGARFSGPAIRRALTKPPGRGARLRLRLTATRAYGVLQSSRAMACATKRLPTAIANRADQPEGMYWGPSDRPATFNDGLLGFDYGANAEIRQPR